jgi:antitoxin (DNA-binding transcriptional repressor) of toxin-antitoxin stability system
MTRLSATEVAREFSAVVNRIGAGEEIEVVRNGVPVVEMRPASARRLVSATRWQELMASAPSPDEDFARDVEAARERVGPPSGAWPS